MFILSTTSNVGFSDLVARHLGIDLVECTISRFSNGEVCIRNVGESIRGKDVYIIFSTNSNVNDEIVEALLLIHTCKSGSAKSVNIVMPCYPYARQDKKLHGREPISAKWIADVLSASGVDSMLTVDLHNSAIQGFSQYTTDNLTAIPIFAEYIQKVLMKNHMCSSNNTRDDFVVVSPDAGGTDRAKKLANKLNLEMAVMYKSRPAPNVVSSIKLLGDVEDKIAIVIDDIADTCGTLKKAADELISTGKAKKVIAFVTHGILSGNAIKNINESKLDKLYITDSVNLHDKNMNCDKICVVTVTALIANAILRHSRNMSLSEMFDMTEEDINHELQSFRIR